MKKSQIKSCAFVLVIGIISVLTVFLLNFKGNSLSDVCRFGSDACLIVGVLFCSGYALYRVYLSGGLDGCGYIVYSLFSSLSFRRKNLLAYGEYKKSLKKDGDFSVAGGLLSVGVGFFISALLFCVNFY